MLNTIIFIVLTVIFIMYLHRVLFGKKHTKTDVLVILLILAMFYHIAKVDMHIDEQIDQAYHKGYVKAVTSAELLNVDEDGYHIAFDEDVHYYIFSD